MTSDTTFLDTYGMLRCRTCFQVSSSCQRDIASEDNGTDLGLCMCNDHDTQGACPIHEYGDDPRVSTYTLITPPRPNHFPYDDAFTRVENSHLDRSDLVHVMGYSAICQHLADLTEVLDRIAARRAS